MSANGKLKVGMYWASSCGGCDISLLEIGVRILELIQIADVAFWPCAADFKYAHVAGYPDGYMDVCFYNGGVRNSEQEEVARLLRNKSKTLVAYGACASDGGIPALANFVTPRAIFDAAYHHNPSIDNAAGVEPQPEVETAVGTLHIPRFYPAVLRLRDVVDVDYELPGCPLRPTACGSRFRRSPAARFRGATTRFASVAATRRCATSARGRSGWSRSASSAATTSFARNPAGACWNREFCAWDRRPGAAAARCA